MGWKAMTNCSQTEKSPNRNLGEYLDDALAQARADEGEWNTIPVEYDVQHTVSTHTHSGMAVQKYLANSGRLRNMAHSMRSKEGCHLDELAHWNS